MTAQPISSITLPPIRNPQQEREWLQIALQNWLNKEFIPEQVNETIARK